MITKEKNSSFDLTARVTLKEWSQFVRITGYHPKQADDYLDYLFKDRIDSPIDRFGDSPVVCVSYADALAYCEFVHGELPTEQQMEQALRDEYPSGLWMWCKSPWRESPDSQELAEFAPVRGYANTPGSSRYPFGPDPCARMVIRKTKRHKEIGFCVVHRKLDVVTAWGKDTECILFDE